MKVYSISSPICSSNNSVSDDKYCSYVNSNTYKMQKKEITFSGKPKKYYATIGDMLADKMGEAWKAFKKWKDTPRIIEEDDFARSQREHQEEFDRWWDNTMH